MHILNDTDKFNITGAVRGLTAPYAGSALLNSALLMAITILVSACGLKGPLYLPEKPSPVVVTPGPSSSASSSSSDSSASSSSAATAESTP